MSTRMCSVYPWHNSTDISKLFPLLITKFKFLPYPIFSLFLICIVLKISFKKFGQEVELTFYFSVLSRSFIVLQKRLLCRIAHLDTIKGKFHILIGEVLPLQSYSVTVTKV